MRQLLLELQKVIRSSTFIVLLILFIALNAGLLYVHPYDDFIPNSSYKKAWEYMDRLSETGKKNFLESYHQKLNQFELPVMGENMELSEDGFRAMFSKEFFIEERLIRHLLDEISRVEDYPKYLESIKEEANVRSSVSIFQLDEYEQKNSQRTLEAFSKLEGKRPVFTNSMAFYESTGFLLTDLLIMALLLYIVIEIFLREKEAGLFSLIRPLPGGRTSFLGAKILMTIFLTICITLIFWFSNISIASIKFGGFDPGVPIQSIRGFESSALNITIGGYLSVFLISKLFIYLFFALLLFTFAIYSKSFIGFFLRILSFFAISYIFYRLPVERDVLALLKYGNIFFILPVHSIYSFYHNVRFFSIPINLVSLFVAAVALGITVPTIVSFRHFNVQELVFRSPNIFNKRASSKAYPCRVSIFYHELYKLVKTLGAGILIIGLGIVMIYRMVGYFPLMSEDEIYYRQYAKAYEGELTEDTLLGIQNEKERFLQLNESLEDMYIQYGSGGITVAQFEAASRSISDELRPERGFMKLFDQMEYAKSRVEGTDEKPHILYDGGVRYLTANDYMEYQRDFISASLLLLGIILSIGSCFSYDFSLGMDKLEFTTYKGRGITLKYKLILSWFISTIFFAMSFFPDLYHAYSSLGLPPSNISIKNLPIFSNMPIDMSISLYLVLLFSYRYFVMLSYTTIIAFISTKIASPAHGIFVSTIVFLIPLILGMAGLSIINKISFNPFISGNLLLNGWHSFTPLILIVPIILGMAAFFGLRKIFHE
jgi:hypothetical protein